MPGAKPMVMDNGVPRALSDAELTKPKRPGEMVIATVVATLLWDSSGLGWGLLTGVVALGWAVDLACYTRWRGGQDA